MLGAYLYRVRRSALKHPWKIIFVLFFVAIFVFMMAYPTIMAMPNSDGTMSNSYVPRDLAVVIGGLYLITIAMFNAMFYTGLKNGVVGFSTADVIYHMAGPFTPRFNLLIAASGTIQICMFVTFLLTTQTALIYNAIGPSTVDMIYMVIGAFISGVVGYFAGSFFGARFSDEEGKKRTVMIIGIVVDAIAVLGFLATFFMKNPSLSGIDIKSVLSALGSSWFIKAFPVGGWMTMMYDGLISNSLIPMIAGAVLTLVSIILILFAYSRFSLEYYDEAIEYAQKAHDLAEQKRAGIDSDTAAMTKRAKVGKEKLGGGDGANALTAIHFLMNKRGSKFFFVNPVGIMYRIITAVYLAFMGQDPERPEMLIFSAFMMMIILNAVLYAGGKTVTEFTKHYIYLIPEPSKTKLFACLKSDLPEMIFDSIICGALMAIMCKFTIPAACAFALMMVIFDLLCEMAALLIMRLLPALGRYLLTFIRNLGTMAVAGIACVPVAVVYLITKSMTFGVLAGAATGFVLLIVLLPVAAIVVDRAEM